MNQVPTRLARLRDILPPTLLAPSQLLFFGPFATYARNEGEFAVPFRDLVAVWAWPFVALTALLAVLLLVLPARWLPRAVGLLFATGVLLWVQGNLLVVDYGPLYGVALDLESHAWRAPWELGLWVAVLFLALRFSGPVARIAPFASAVLMALQLTVAAVSATDSVREADTSAAPDDPQWTEVPERIFELSRDRNVVHIVLDGFLSDVFGEWLERERAAFDRDFSGFTFFREHLGAFRTTRASMPAMFSGVPYRNNQRFDRFRQRLARRPSIFSVLAGEGYRVNSVTFHNSEHPPASMRRAAVRYSVPTPFASRRSYERFAAAELFDLTLFRHVPHGLKGMVYNDDTWLTQRLTGASARGSRPSNHVAFLDEFTDRMAPATDDPVYLFLHVLPPHPPLVLDAECRFVGRQKFTAAAYGAQARCALRVVQRFLHRLRELDAYDRSVIVVAADHGWMFERPGHPLKGIPTPAGPLDRIASGAMPLLAVKPAGASGPVRTSQAPTSVTDIPATVATLAGVAAHPLPGRSVFDVAPAEPRTRTYAFHSWSDGDWKRRYFQAMLLFDVNGPVLRPESWTFRRVIFDPTTRLEEAIERRQIGLSGVQAGGDGPFRWGEPYVATWAPPSARQVNITARRAPGLAAALALTIRIDGRAVARHELGDGEWHAWSQPLEPRERGAPVAIELILDQPARTRDSPLYVVQYRSPLWSR